MRADHILKCHGFCKLQREHVDQQLKSKLEALPEEYDWYDVEKVLAESADEPTEEEESSAN